VGGRSSEAQGRQPHRTPPAARRPTGESRSCRPGLQGATSMVLGPLAAGRRCRHQSTLPVAVPAPAARRRRGAHAPDERTSGGEGSPSPSRRRVGPAAGHTGRSARRSSRTTTSVATARLASRDRARITASADAPAHDAPRPGTIPEHLPPLRSSTRRPRATRSPDPRHIHRHQDAHVATRRRW
jgi:hypothetical protein